MKISDLKVGDKLKVFVPTNSFETINTLNDIIEITEITSDKSNTLWISHEPDSFSGGGFRIKDEDNDYSGYILGEHVKLITKRSKECYKYLIKLLKELNIR